MSVAPILHFALKGGAIFAAAVALVGGIVGFALAGVPGMLGALTGAVIAGFYVALTAVSILVAGRVTAKDPASPMFFAVVLAFWLVKLITFPILLVVLRGQDWLHPFAFFATVVIAVIGSLVIDAIAVQRSRVPYVSDVTLPASGERSED